LKNQKQYKIGIFGKYMKLNVSFLMGYTCW